MAIFRSIDKQIQRLPELPEACINAYHRTRQVDKLKPLCHAPFVNMNFSRSGEILACCHNRVLSMGKYPEQTVNEIWSSKKARSFRNLINKNTLPSGCNVCHDALSHSNFRNVMARGMDEIPISRQQPMMMEFELDNICNLECIMCEGELSSSIRKNCEKKPPFKSVYDDAFVEQISPWLQNTKLLRFSGGEPFLIPLYYRIWDILLQSNTSCEVFIQTNGTILNDGVKTYLKNLPVSIGVSLDSLHKECFEHIRQNAKLETVLENVHVFKELLSSKKQPGRLLINTTVMRENWHDIPEILHFVNKHGFYFNFNTLWEPGKVALHNLDSTSLQEIHGFYTQHAFPETNRIEKANAESFQSLTMQINAWYEEQKEQERLNDIIKNKSREELEEFFLQNIRQNITDKSLIRKLEHAMQDIKTGTDYEKTLHFLCRIPPEKISDTLKTYNIRELQKLIADKIMHNK